MAMRGPNCIVLRCPPPETHTHTPHTIPLSCALGPVQALTAKRYECGHWLHTVFIQVLMQWDKEKDDWVISVFMRHSLDLHWM